MLCSPVVYHLHNSSEHYSMIKGKSGDHSLILTRWNILSNLFGNVCCLSGVAISTAPHVSATPRPAVELKRAARTERAETVSYWFCLKIIVVLYFESFPSF